MIRLCFCVCFLRPSILAPLVSCQRPVRFPDSTLSAQSVPTMCAGQLAALAPGGLVDSESSTVLQPLKTSPSSDILCSTYTSDAALSVPSLCAPTPGEPRSMQTNAKHATIRVFVFSERITAGRLILLSFFPLTPLSSINLFLFLSLSLIISTSLNTSIVSVTPCSLSPPPPFSFPPPLFSGCAKFSWGSERLAFKPGGRRTRFLSTPCLALCV